MKNNNKIFSIVFGLIILTSLSITNKITIRGSEGNSSPLNIEFSTFFGGNGEDGTGRVSLDSVGNIVIASKTPSSDFPILNAYQPIKNSSDDGIIAKFSPNGQELLFSTFFGGNGDEYIYSVVVDNNDDIIIAGTTDSTVFPLKNAIKTNRSESSREVFLAKFSSDGQELYFSTYICGTSTWVVDIEVDSFDNIILAGSTDVEELNLTEGTYQPTKNNSTDAFVTKLSADGQTIIFSTYLGGNEFENIRSMTVDSDYNIIVSGYTNSDDFPLANSLRDKSASTYDNYISKISSNGQNLLFSSYFGGTRNWGLNELTVDGMDNIIFVGETNSISFPLFEAYQSNYAGGETDGFIAKIEIDEYSLVFSTFLGGSNYDGVHSILVDNYGDLIVTGTTASFNFPTLNPYQTYNGQQDAYICKMDEIGQIKEIASYFGGSGADFSFGTTLESSNNSIVMFGHTNSISNFPLVKPYQDEYKGGYFDMFLCKFTITTTSEIGINIFYLTSFLTLFMIIAFIHVKRIFVKTSQKLKMIN